MIIRRQLYADQKLPVKKPNDSGMELKPIFKKVAPSSAGNKILQTASSGGSIVRDVEDLLKPIQNQKHQEELVNSNQNLKERTERNLWRNDEVMEMLYTMQELKALERLNDKTVKSENVFKDVEVVMHRNGFVKKSHVQIWTKWKFLKSTYMTSRRNGVIPRMVPPQVYDTIHKMITGLNQSITDSCSSVDGDNSSVTGMVISGVEGGVNETSTAATANGEENDSYGVAHPIFGFRLGMVKSEPEDTGYEAVENHGTDKDPLGEEQSPAKSDNQVKEENNQNNQKLNKVAEPLQKTLEIPHRGRGRPPKNPPAASSTPNSSPSPATKSAQMPPLRVAPFAKALNNTNSLPVNRPPPPLTMPPTPRIRVANLTNLKNNDPSRFAQPKLTPKPNHQPPTSTVQQMRLPKEVTVTQTRASSTPSPSYPKMKQIPMRKTPYSLRPDRAIPDLDASLSPPPPPIEKPSSKRIEEVPSIRQLMLQSNPNILQNNNNNRKRRLDVQDSLMGKQAKYSNNSMENDLNTTKPLNNNTNNNKNHTKSEDYGKVLQNVMVDLSISLRKMQTEMMQDFFKKQNELLEKEHRFQMQQDQMLMKAFQEQTQEIMLSVKQLVGSIKTNKNEAKLNCKTRMLQRQQRRQVREDEEEEREDEEMEEEHMEGEDEQEQEQEQNHDQQLEEEYTDSEGQQEQIEEHDDSENEEQEDLDNHNNEEEEDEEQSQTTEEHQENGLTAEENDDDNSNDSTEDE
ncbi:martik [Cochliomyia hominivorax]